MYLKQLLPNYKTNYENETVKRKWLNAQIHCIQALVILITNRTYRDIENDNILTGEQKRSNDN